MPPSSRETIAHLITNGAKKLTASLHNDPTPTNVFLSVLRRENEQFLMNDLCK